MKEDKVTILERHQDAIKNQSSQPAFKSSAEITNNGDYEVPPHGDGSYMMHGRYYIAPKEKPKNFYPHRIDI